jgi:anti-sigma factor RsiW
MMNCRELVDLLLDFVAEELPEEHREQIRDHLCQCPPCVHLVETYRLTIVLTRKLPRTPLPAHLQERLRQAMAQCDQPPG